MAGRPRAYLFYGSDTRASLREVARWRAVFEQKHGSYASFCIEADELDAARFADELTRCLQGNTLFDEPRLIVIRRLTVQEKGKSVPFTKALITALQPSILADENLTVAVWEEADLKTESLLLGFFESQEKAGVAKIHRFSVPTVAGLGRAVHTLLEKEGLDIEPEALRWLGDQYGWIERKSRLELRLKPGDTWEGDYRGWWLYQIIDGAILRNTSGILSLSDVQAGHRALGEPVGAFDIASALSSGNWAKTRALSSRFIAESTESGDYFALLAALRWQLRRKSSLSHVATAYAERLLGEVEVAAKNGIPEPSWLLSLLISRLEASSELEPLLPYRTLWLSQLPRG